MKPDFGYDFEVGTARVPGLSPLQATLLRTELSRAYFVGCAHGREAVVEHLTGAREPFPLPQKDS